MASPTGNEEYSFLILGVEYRPLLENNTIEEQNGKCLIYVRKYK